MCPLNSIAADNRVCSGSAAEAGTKRSEKQALQRNTKGGLSNGKAVVSLRVPQKRAEDSETLIVKDAVELGAMPANGVAVFWR